MHLIAQSTTFVLLIYLISMNKAEVIGSCGVTRSLEFDRCFARPFTIGSNSTFAKNNRQLDAYCRESRESIRCVKSFASTCLTGMGKQSTSILLHGLNKNVKHICTVMDKKSAIAASVCFNSVLNDLNKFMDEFADDYRLVNHMNTKDKVIGLCCSYYKFHDKLITRSSNVCDKNSIQYMKDFLNRSAGEMLDLLCANIKPKSDKCLHLQFPDSKSILNSTKSFTFIPPLMIVLNNL